MATLSLRQIVGGGYDQYWNSKALYRAIKGSKGSKKSKTAALWHIFHMMKYPQANTLVIRKVFGTLQQSCYTDLLWAIDKLGVTQYWKASVSPLQLTYIPTGQVIIFRGLDDPLKLASITVRIGIICWVWIQEAFQLPNEDAFLKVDFSIRGLIPPGSGLWKSYTITFNPWSQHTWLKSRFFDNPDEDTLAMTTTYKCNEFLDEKDVQKWQKLYKTNPRAARVICEGDWGIAEGLIYNNWHEEEFDWRDIADQEGVRTAFGLDFGYAVSYNAFAAILVDVQHRKLWVYDEMYERGLSNIDIAKKITQLGYAKEEIWADAAEPKSIYELQNGFTQEVVDDYGRYQLAHWQLPAIRPALKGPDSVANGIQRLQSFEIIVHPRCVNTIMQLNNYCYDTDKDGNFTDKPIKDFDHCLVPGTIIMTDRGEVPIEDVRIGDHVSTYDGYMEVTSAGLTQRNQPIWRLTLEDGRVLEGTWNHPVMTTHGVKYLSSLSDSDEVIVWSGKQSNMMADNGTGTPTRGISNSTQPISTDTCGRNTTGQSRKGIISTTSTGTKQTTTSPTSCVLHPSSTDMNIQIQQGYTNGESVTSQETRTSAENGTSQRRDTSGTSPMQDPLENRQSTPVSSAGGSSQLRSDLIASAQADANLHGEELTTSMKRTEFVSNVVRCSQLSSTSPQGFAPVRVSTLTKDVMRSDVYDLTVQGTHDFFANGILVLNCMDAIRYASTKFFVKGRGHVYEAKGVDAPTPQKRRSRRVIAST